MSVWLLMFKMANEKVDLGQIRSEDYYFSCLLYCDINVRIILFGVEEYLRPPL